MTENKGYHAHIYYAPDTKPVAERLRETIAGKFAVEPGALSDEPRGPHPIPQFVVIFDHQDSHDGQNDKFLCRMQSANVDRHSSRILSCRPRQHNFTVCS